MVLDDYVTGYVVNSVTDKAYKTTWIEFNKLSDIYQSLKDKNYSDNIFLGYATIPKKKIDFPVSTGDVLVRDTTGGGYFNKWDNEIPVEWQ